MLHAAVLALLTLGSSAEPEIVPGQVLVKVRAGASPAFASLEHVHGSRRTLAIPRRDDRVGLGRIRTLEVEPGQEAAVVARLADEPWVEWVELNTLGGGIAGTLTPDDELWSFQWPLHQANDIDMDMPEAWALRGTFEADSTLLVGVIDSGFPLDTVEPDLSAMHFVDPVDVPNGLDDDGNGFVDDVSGYDFVEDEANPDGGHPHGFNISSVLAARTNNLTGLAGIAPGVQLLHARAFGDDGDFPCCGPYAGKVAAAAAIEYMVDNGAELVNNSWVDETGPTQVILDAVQYAVDNGVHMVFAAGNQDLTDAYPVQHPGVVAVAAIDGSNVKAFFSNFGPWVDLNAGGLSVPALDEDLGGVFVSGTSLSSPYVAGIAALLLSEDRDLSVSDLRAILVEGAVDNSAANPGFVGQLGSGHANAHESLLLLEPFDDLGGQLAGSTEPVLNAWGGTGAGETLHFSASGLPASAAGLFVAGATQVNVSLLGGTLVPAPTVTAPVAANAEGELFIPVTLGAALPTGLRLFVQGLFVDGGAPQNFAFTNAVRVTGQ